MSAQLDTLTQAVEDITKVAEDAISLVGNLKTELDAAIAANTAGDDGAALDALSAKLEAEKDKLATAVSAATPAPAETPATPSSEGAE